MLTPLEQAVLRAWIKGLPTDTYADELPPGAHVTSLLQSLRQRLTLKARRLNTPWQHFFQQPRRTEPAWEQTALGHLHWLLTQADIRPALDQPLAFWLDDAWLPSLHEAGLTDCAAWFTWRSSQGNDWWRKIAGIGQQGAHALEQRLKQLWPCPPLRTLPVPMIHYQTGVVPLTRLLIPAELDGSQGAWRGAGDCFIPADNDLQAIDCWLARLDPASHTRRAYQREAERLLLWALLERQKALSSLTLVDVADYRRFLQAPQPVARWVGPNRPKSSPDWKPFTGTLSPRSIGHAETCLSHLFGFLLAQGYVRLNPYSSLPKLRPTPGRFNGQHSLSAAQWQFMNEFIARQLTEQTGPAYRRWLRIRLMVRLLYSTGLRLHELAQARRGHLLRQEREGQSQLWLTVLGKGKRQREVPLPAALPPLLAETTQVLTGRAWRRPSDDAPLIPPLRQPFDRPLTPKAIYLELKHCFQWAADALEATEPESANHLRQATTHWLRHTHGTHAVNKNIPLTVIRDNLGHASIATTSHYLHAEADERYRAFQDFDTVDRAPHVD